MNLICCGKELPVSKGEAHCPKCGYTYAVEAVAPEPEPCEYVINTGRVMVYGALALAIVLFCVAVASCVG